MVHIMFRFVRFRFPRLGSFSSSVFQSPVLGALINFQSSCGEAPWVFSVCPSTKISRVHDKSGFLQLSSHSSISNFLELMQ